VPLVHPITGVLEGILDLTCLASEANELMLPLLLEASREVHDRFVADSSLSEQALLASFLRAARRTRRPVVCLNDHIVITNDAARALAPSDYALLWEHFAVGRDRSITRVLPHVELSEGRVFDVRMRPVAAGAGVAGAVVELKPPERQRRAGLRAVEPPAPRDAGPSLVGRSDTWRRVVADVDLQARHRQPVLVVGERGVGKLQCALAIHARGSTWSEPVSVLDAAMSVVDREVDWVEPLRARLRQPEGTVVLRHLESLEGRTVMATIALVDAVDAEVGPRLLATITDQRRRDADFGALLDRFDAAIVVPPLRSRPEDVVDLFEAFAHAPGHRSSGSVSPEVLRALMRYRWPGNARELRRVVRAVALRRPSGQLTLDDLPPEIRTDIAPAGLSRIAEIEREAIVTALHDAGGNKQAAAVRLGLSRSTLYRKLGAYGL
jgi:transcriptional regulator of acetoin/glycerol metabolism